jgi:hypothetical protein
MSNRNLAILIATAVLLVVGGLVFRAFFDDRKPGAVTPGTAPASEDETRTGVRVRVSGCNRESEQGPTVLVGYAENSGNVDLHYVTVQSIWKNSAGQVIASDTLYAVNGQSLAPGERVTFTDSSAVRGVARCNAEAIDWW